MVKKFIFDIWGNQKCVYVEFEEFSFVVDLVLQYMSCDKVEKMIEDIECKMKKVVKELDFILVV